MGTLPDFRTFPPDDLLGLFTCQRGYLQGYKTCKIAYVAICGRSCHIMPVLIGPCLVWLLFLMPIDSKCVLHRNWCIHFYHRGIQNPTTYTFSPSNANYSIPSVDRVRTGPGKSWNLIMWFPSLESHGIFVQVMESHGILY